MKVGPDDAQKWFWRLGGTQGVGCDFDTLKAWALDEPTEVDHDSAQSTGSFLTPQQYNDRATSREKRLQEVYKLRHAVTRASVSSEARTSVPDSSGAESTKTT